MELALWPKEVLACDSSVSNSWVAGIIGLYLKAGLFQIIMLLLFSLLKIRQYTIFQLKYAHLIS